MRGRVCGAERGRWSNGRWERWALAPGEGNPAEGWQHTGIVPFPPGFTKHRRLRAVAAVPAGRLPAGTRSAGRPAPRRHTLCQAAGRLGPSSGWGTPGPITLLGAGGGSSPGCAAAVGTARAAEHPRHPMLGPLSCPSAPATCTSLWCSLAVSLGGFVTLFNFLFLFIPGELWLLMATTSPSCWF